MENKEEHPDEPASPDSRINWAIYILTTADCCLICGGVAPLSLSHALRGGGWFWIALVLGGLTGLVINWARPRYESTVGRWRKFYDFLLKQMPPPD